MLDTTNTRSTDFSESETPETRLIVAEGEEDDASNEDRNEQINEQIEDETENSDEGSYRSLESPIYDCSAEHHIDPRLNLSRPLLSPNNRYLRLLPDDVPLSDVPLCEDEEAYFELVNQVRGFEQNHRDLESCRTQRESDSFAFVSVYNCLTGVSYESDSDEASVNNNPPISEHILRW